MRVESTAKPYCVLQFTMQCRYSKKEDTTTMWYQHTPRKWVNCWAITLKSAGCFKIDCMLAVEQMKFWAGLSCDHVIEKTLWGRLKLHTAEEKYGSKMAENQRSFWTVSNRIISEYKIVMQDINELIYNTSEKHKDSSTSRIERGNLDISKYIQSCHHVRLLLLTTLWETSSMV